MSSILLVTPRETGCAGIWLRACLAGEALSSDPGIVKEWKGERKGVEAGREKGRAGRREGGRERFTVLALPLFLILDRLLFMSKSRSNGVL